MLKLTKTGIGLLTRQYRSVLKKCWLINVGAWLFGAIGKTATTLLSQTLRGTLNGGAFNVMDSLFAKHAFKQKLVTTTAIGLVGMAVIVPTEAYAVDIGSYAYSDATIRADSNDGWCDNGDGTYLLSCVAHRNSLASITDWHYHAVEYKYHTISTSNTIIENLEALDRVIGSYPVYSDNGSQMQVANHYYLVSQRKNNQRPFSIDAGGNISHNLIALDYAIGALPSGTYVSNMKSMGDNIKALDQAFNNYYRKEDLGGRQVIDFARYFKSEKFGENARFLGVDLTSESEDLPSNLTSKIGGFATNHPPRLGAFAKCEKACSRPSERYIAALGKNRVFENIASTDAGMFLFASQTRKNVLDSFSQNARFLNDKSTIFEALATKVPAAELRCKIVNETSKKFAEMPHNSPAGEGTLSAFHRKAESVMDSLSKCRAANDNSSIISNNSNDKTGVFGAPTVAGTTLNGRRRFNVVIADFLQNAQFMTVANDNFATVTTSKAA